MATLHVVNGPTAGSQVSLGQTAVTVGRNRTCEVVVLENSVSREHARIECREGRYFIADLNSRNGTFLNGKQISGVTPLRNNDQIRIADWQCVFREQESGGLGTELRSPHPLFQALAEGSEAGSDRLQFQVSFSGPVEAECRRLRDNLETNHVFLVRAEATALPRLLKDSGSAALDILGRDFHRVVVLDGAAGLASDRGPFSLERFLRHAYERMVQAFGLRASLESFHVENVSQILKDEPRSLFCFLNVQLLSAADLRRLRGFTQEAHQVLFLCCGERDLASEEAEEEVRDWNSSVASLTVSPHKGSDLDLLDVCNHWHQAGDLDSRCQRIATDLLSLYRQADRVLLILADRGDNNQFKLIPCVIKTRRASEESSARFSKTIVTRCLDTGEGLFSEDVQHDERFSVSQSLADVQPRSLMCVPLRGPTGQTFGVLQLDTQTRGKTFASEDLNLLWRLANQVSVVLENVRLQEEAVKRERLRRDLELAQEVQLSFLPKSLPEVPGYDFYAYYQAAQAVGGDYYDFIPLPGGRLAVAVADVAGKGVAASLLMAKLSSETRFSLSTEPDLGAAVTKLNDLLYQFTSQADRFITLVIAVLDSTEHTLTMVSAGLESPLLYRPTSQSLEEVLSQRAVGVPLGIMEGFLFESCQINLQPGESLLLLTDGIAETLDVTNKPFGLSGIHAALRNAGNATPQQLVDQLVRAGQAHATGRQPFDDVTIVCVGRRPQP